MQHAFRPRQHALRLAFVALAAGYTATAVAQSSIVVEEISVTARRRTELAQDVRHALRQSAEQYLDATRDHFGDIDCALEGNVHYVQACHVHEQLGG